jgi:hypothetical protein
VVPFRVERVPADVERLHFGSGDLDALLARSACRLDVAAISSTMANRSVRGPAAPSLCDVANRKAEELRARRHSEDIRPGHAQGLEQPVSGACACGDRRACGTRRDHRADVAGAGGNAVGFHSLPRARGALSRPGFPDPVSSTIAPCLRPTFLHFRQPATAAYAAAIEAR